MTATDKVPEGICPSCLRRFMTPFCSNEPDRCFTRWYTPPDLMHGHEIKVCADLHIARLQERIKLLETERATMVLEMHRHYHPDRHKYDGRLP